MPSKFFTDVDGDAVSTTDVSFDVAAFEKACSAHGVKLVHWRAMRCPVGLVDKYDGRRPDHDHSGCSNGFVYTLAGPIKGLFTGNGEKHSLTDVGFIDGSTVQVTIQRFYSESDEEVQIANFDRIYLDEETVTVPTWQLFDAHITGRDRLQFPVVRVQDLVDSSDNRYVEGRDFDVVNGCLVWSGRRPMPNQICACRYTYRPYWYVKQLLHQVRVIQRYDPEAAGRVTERMPQAMLLQREYVFEKEANDSQQAPPSPAQAPGPADGSFGPR